MTLPTINQMNLRSSRSRHRTILALILHALCVTISQSKKPSQLYPTSDGQFSSVLDRRKIDTAATQPSDNPLILASLEERSRYQLANDNQQLTITEAVTLPKQANISSANSLNQLLLSHAASHNQLLPKKSFANKSNAVSAESNRAADDFAQRLPQAIIIGVKKGGTRALLEYLRIHPDIRAPGPEIHFFDRFYQRGLEWYRRQMPTTLPHQLTLEKTPSYFITKDAPKRIHAMTPNVKLLVVVRNPVTRAISDYTQTASKRPEILPFERMAFRDFERGEVNTSWGAVKIGLYFRHLKRWRQYFPLANIHFVSGEALITNPAEEMQKVEQFLGLERVISPENFLYNSTRKKGFPCIKRSSQKPNEALVSKAKGKEPLAYSKYTGAKPRCLGKTKGRTHPHIDPLAIERLAAFFEPFNRQFYKAVGRDFGW